jgi:IclR helix-turn-helix domain
VPAGVASERARRSPAGSIQDTGITLELTPAQILAVCEGSEASGSRHDLLNRLGGDADRLRALLEQIVSEPKGKHSQSLARGLYVFACLPSDGQTVGVVDFAKRLGMTPSTVHRYLRSLLLAGLAQRHEDTREYSQAPGFQPQDESLGAA